MDHQEAVRAGLLALHETIEDTREVSPDMFMALWNQEAERHLQRFLSGEITFDQQRLMRVKAVFARLGHELTDQAAWDIFQRYLAAYEAGWELYDDVLPCLRSVLPYRLGVVFNGNSEQQRDKLRKTGLTPHFSSVVISSALGVSKPHPEIFQRSLAELEAAPEETLYVGDHLQSDALGAAGAGIWGVWLARGGHTGETSAIAVPIIHTLLQLKGIIDTLDAEDVAARA